MAVLVYTTYRREELGAERWVAETEVIPDNWALMSDDERENFDHDDYPVEFYEFRGPKAHQEAIKKARRMLRVSCFGAVRVYRQVVDWFVEEDRVAQWEVAGEVEYVD